MSKTRIIAKIEVKDHQVVKGIRMEGLRVLGSPSYFSKKYYEEGIDEIIYQDVFASLLGRNAILNLIKETASNIHIPLTISGGIKKLKDIYDILGHGADRVALNSVVFKDPKIIKKAVKEFGSSTIINNLDIGIKNEKYYLFTENGKNIRKINFIDWIKKIQDFGVSEFMINTIHKDGTMEGFDLKLLEILDKVIKIPFVFGGGFGKKEHLLDLYNFSKNISGVVMSSALHYNNLDKNYNNSYGNIDFLKSNLKKKKLEKISVKKLKIFLIKNKILCRL